MTWWTSIVVVGVILLKRDSLCQALSFQLEETNVTAKEGECVRIHYTGSGLWSAESKYLFWFKNANYNTELKEFDGTVVHSTNLKRPAHQDFVGRVKVTEPSTNNVKGDIQICCLHMNDSGNYSFRYEGTSWNRRYITNPEVKLQVHENPCKVSFQTSPIYLKESDEAVFKCSTLSSCGTQPVIKGLPERSELNTSSYTSTVAKFMVDWEDHQKQLSCEVPGVINKCFHQNITLTVQYSPRKPVLSGTGNSVKLGGSLTLTCSAKAVPAPTKYTWFFHTERKNWATPSPGWPTMIVNNMLEIQHVTRAHHGCYNCSATNTRGQGENSSSYCVEVLFAPDRPDLSVVPLATEGEVITIRCRVESWPLPSSLNLSWRSTRDPSMHTLLHHVSGATSLTRTLNVTYTSAGRYTCKAQNSQGSNQSEMELTVNYAPQNVSVKVEPSLEVTEGIRLELFCEAQSVPPVRSYNWTRTSAGQEEVVGSDQRLTIVSVTLADDGGYRCSVQNEVGSRASPNVRVTVKYAPQNVSVKVEPSLEVTEGIRLKLFCEAQSVPPVRSYNWTRTSAGQEEVVGSDQRLTIVSVTSADDGGYRCSVQNEVGSSASPNVRVTVKYAPKYAKITGLSGDEYDADVPIQLSCHSISFPAVTWYTWYKKLNNKSNEVFVQSNQNLTVDPDHPGIYYCCASNSEGRTKSNSVRLFLKTGRLKEIFWAIPFVCILVLAVITYLVCRYKRKKFVSDGALDPLPRLVTPSADARGSRDDLLPNQARSHTGHAFSQAPRSSAAGPERLFCSTIDTVYSTVNLPTGMQPIREDHGSAGDEVNYASLHFPSQGLSQGSSPPAAMENDVHAKIANKDYENLDEVNQPVDIELNYSQVTFTAKQRSKSSKTKKTTR